jgi:hypothetical protein
MQNSIRPRSASACHFSGKMEKIRIKTPIIPNNTATQNSLKRLYATPFTTSTEGRSTAIIEQNVFFTIFFDTIL